MRDIPILPEHLAAFRGVSIANGIVLIFRPVNPHAAKRMQQGAAGKSIRVKGKSAEHGASLSGLIPFNAGWSKIGFGSSDASKIDYYTKLNAEAVKSGEIKKKSLTNDSGEPVFGLVNSEGKPILIKGEPVFVARKSDGTFHIDGTDEIYKVKPADTLEPIEILTYPDGTPITADYDLLCVGLPSERGSPESLGEQGIAPADEHAVVTALGVDTGRHRAVRHASEAYSPGDEGFEGSGYVVFEPNGAVSLCTPDQVRSFITKYRAEGLHFGLKTSWKIGPHVSPPASPPASPHASRSLSPGGRELGR
jgi:hypothetical protein